MSPLTLLWLIAGCLMLQPLSTDLYLPSLPHLATYFAVRPADVQQTLSLFVLGFGCAQLLSGPLSDRYGRRPVLMGGLMIYSLASVACAFAPTLSLLVVARFLQAVGSCTAVVVARAIIRDAYTPAEGARIVAKASSLLALAPLLGPVAGGYLQVAFGWRAAFAFMTAFCLLLGMAAWRWLEETNDTPNLAALRLGGLARIYGGIARTPVFWAYTLLGALSYACIFVYISGSSFVLIRILGVSTQHYGWLYAFGVTGYLSGTILCRRLLMTIGIERTVNVGASISFTAGLMLLGLVESGAHHWSVFVAGQFVTMFAHGVNFPCAQTGSVAPFPRQAGSAAGLFGFFTMAAALLAGYWVGTSHDGTVYPLARISAILGTVLFVTTRLLARHRPLPA